MHFVLQTPSLQHLAGVKIVAHLWSQRDIFPHLAQIFYRSPAMEMEMIMVGNPTKYFNKWKALEKKVEEKVESKVRALKLPQPCKRQLLNFIIPLGQKFFGWCRYHCVEKNNFQFLESLLPQQVCWSMHGTVDYTKTAELMVKDDRVDVGRRYEIACINCLEDEARELIQLIPEERKREYATRGINDWLKLDHRYLIDFNTCTLSGDVAPLHKSFQSKMRKNHSSFNKCLFEVMLTVGTPATCEYLFKKLHQIEKDQVLKECKKVILGHRYSSSTSTLLYYLSLMNAEQQEDMFREGNVDVLLELLLLWPLQSLFVEVAERGWQFMDNYDRNGLLRAIIDKISHGCRDYDYAQLFWECWRLASVKYQQQFLCCYPHLDDLLRTKREDFVKLILNEASSYYLRGFLENRFGSIEHVLTDENAISEAALMECKQTAALNSSKDQDNVEKRLRSQHVSRLVDQAMESRKKRRRLV